MKISDITVTLFAWDDLPPRQFGRHTGRMPGGRSELGLVTIRTDDGVEGHSFLGSSSRGANFDAESLIRFLKPLLVGQNPLDRERLYQQMWARNRNTTLRCIGAVDVALWDLGGKAAGLPIHRMLGSFRDSIPAYASSAVLPSKEAYAEEAQRIRESGLSAYKIHPPAVWQQDIEICRHVRKAVGDGYRLMLDSTCSYNYTEALRVGRALEELDYYWYEDPLDTDDITNYVKLRQKLDIPIMATEYSPGGFQAYAPWIVMQATDFLRGDVAVKGGISALVKIAHLAEAFHMNLEVHHGGNSLNNVANLHVILAIPNTEYFEILLPDATQKYGLLEDITPARDGTVRPPDGPGLGAKIDFGLIERKKPACCPEVAMADVVAILKEWQELAGAIITASAAFAVAFLVSHIDRRREDISAAMVLVGNLTTVMAANETLKTLAEKEEVSDDDYPMWVAQRLSSSPPALSPLFDGCVAKLFPVDTNLAAHLELFNVIYRSVERHLHRLNEDISYFREHKKLLRSKEDVTADAEVVKSGFVMAAKHAQCAERLIALLVLSRWPTVHRLMRLVWKNRLDCECNAFLKTHAL